MFSEQQASNMAISTNRDQLYRFQSENRLARTIVCCFLANIRHCLILARKHQTIFTLLENGKEEAQQISLDCAPCSRLS
jgi:hypothetical protein